MSEILVALIGGFVGGILGVIGTLVSTYYGPRKFEEWKENQKEEREYGPRKKLLLDLLKSKNYVTRSIEYLSLVTGTSLDECRRLLIEIEARGVRMENGEEGWALISRKPLDEKQ